MVTFKRLRAAYTALFTPPQDASETHFFDFNAIGRFYDPYAPDLERIRRVSEPPRSPEFPILGAGPRRLDRSEGLERR
jgi:hypothetical protein